MKKNSDTDTDTDTDSELSDGAIEDLNQFQLDLASLHSRNQVTENIQDEVSEEINPEQSREPSTVSLASQAGQIQQSPQPEIVYVAAPPQISSAQVAGEIARQSEQNARNRTKASLRDQKETERLTRPGVQADVEEDCRVLNAYRQAYKNKINYKFRPMYTVSMKPEVLKAERKEVETILNTQDIPTILSSFLIKGAELLELASLALGYPEFNLVGLSDDTTISIKSGYFQSEIEQLSIEWASWLGMSAEKRLAGKGLWLVVNRLMQNSSRVIKATVSEQFIQRTSDL